MLIRSVIRKAKQYLAVTLVLSISLLPCFLLTGSATDITENEAAQSGLKQKSDELGQQLDEAKQNTQAQEAKQQELQNKINALEQQIDTTNKQIAQLNDEITQKSQAMAGTQAEADKDFSVLKQRLRAIYMAGETSTLDIILGATDFSDFMDKAEILSIVGRHDTQLIQTLNGKVGSIKAEKESVEQSRAEVTRKKTELGFQQQELAQLEAENQAVLDQLQEQQNVVQKDLDENDAELQSIESKIKEYYADQQRQQEEAKKRQEQEQKNRNSGGSGSSAGSGSSSDSGGGSSGGSGSSSGGGSGSSSSSDSGGGVPSAGMFVWPLPGYNYVISDFYDTEDRSHMHGAIDITGSGVYRASIRAAASGYVYYAESGGWGGGYGSYVMLSHDGGYMTVYGHMSEVDVSTGDYVQQGQVIGRVGSTGNSTGPHLHFEIRENGTKIDPMQFFR